MNTVLDSMRNKPHIKKRNYQKKIDKFTSQLHFLKLILTTFLHLYKNHKVNLRALYRFNSKVLLIIKTRGIHSAISWTKEARQIFQCYLLGTQFIPTKVSTTGGLPKILHPSLRREIRNGNKPIISCVMTLFSWTRMLNLGRFSDKDIEPILRFPDKPYNPDFARYVKDFVSELRIPFSLEDFKEFHLSTRRGPNGHAFHTNILDALSLPTSLIDSIGVLAGQDLKQRILDWISYSSTALNVLDLENKYNNEPLCIRRIVDFPDKEDKVRVIAILDYFSQTSLRPLHQFIFKILKKIKQDKTFSQGAGIHDKASIYYSIDLKNATDRFPIDYICDVLKGFIPEDKVAAWKDIMVGYPFVHNRLNKDIKYNCGNPMGAYSSWGAFTLAHHYLMYLACRRVGLHWKFAKYSILGDDVVIRDKKLGDSYLFLLEYYGIPYSKPKTHVSELGFEFAKRWFIREREVSPLPIAGLWSTRRFASRFATTLYEHIPKGLAVVVPDFVEKYAQLSGMNSKIQEKWFIQGWTVSILLGIFKAKNWTFEQGLTALAELNKLRPWPKGPYPLTNDMASGMFSNACRISFDKSNELSEKEDFIPLGNLVTKFMMTPPVYKERPKTMPMQFIPHFDVHNQLIQVVGDLSDLIEQQKDLPSYEWSKKIRAVTAPLSDNIYYTDRYDVIHYMSSRIVPLWLEEFKRERDTLSYTYIAPIVNRGVHYPNKHLRDFIEGEKKL